MVVPVPIEGFDCESCRTHLVCEDDGRLRCPACGEYYGNPYAECDVAVMVEGFGPQILDYPTVIVAECPLCLRDAAFHGQPPACPECGLVVTWFDNARPM